MILYNGTVYPSEAQDKLLKRLDKDIERTRESLKLDTETVIAAAGRLSRLIETMPADSFSDVLSDGQGQEYLRIAADFLNEDNIRFRLKKELGKNYSKPKCFCPPYGINSVQVRTVPLGTLFHIAAGNIDVLPAVSVLEGLLTGNVNILKLPQADKGLTIWLFRNLIEYEPKLAPFVYIFDTPSTDIEAMKKMAEISDGISVWGGDEAVKAVRQLAPVNVKLMEWGHRLSFAYISGYTDKNREMTALAEHIAATRQLLCSSCQTIFIDTDQRNAVVSFCKEFLPYLERAAEKFPHGNETGVSAETTLRQCTERFEGHIGKAGERKCFKGRNCSVTACADSVPELSYMYGNVLVKPLPREYMLTNLRKARGYLQTAGLICKESDREVLSEMLIRSGVNRVMKAGNMSVSFCGESHDGEYPLRRYVRIVNTEM